MTTPEQIRSSIESIVNKNQIFAETLKDGFVDDIDQEKINIALEDIKKEIGGLTQHPEELKLFNDELRKQVEEKGLFAKKVENTSTQETDTLKTQIENNTPIDYNNNITLRLGILEGNIQALRKQLAAIGRHSNKIDRRFLKDVRNILKEAKKEQIDVNQRYSDYIERKDFDDIRSPEDVDSMLLEIENKITYARQAGSKVVTGQGPGSVINTNNTSSSNTIPATCDNTNNVINHNGTLGEQFAANGALGALNAGLETAGAGPEMRSRAYKVGNLVRGATKLFGGIRAGWNFLKSSFNAAFKGGSLADVAKYGGILALGYVTGPSVDKLIRGGDTSRQAAELFGAAGGKTPAEIKENTKDAEIQVDAKICSELFKNIPRKDRSQFTTEQGAIDFEKLKGYLLQKEGVEGVKYKALQEIEQSNSLSRIQNFLTAMGINGLYIIQKAKNNPNETITKTYEEAKKRGDEVAETYNWEDAAKVRPMIDTIDAEMVKNNDPSYTSFKEKKMDIEKELNILYVKHKNARPIKIIYNTTSQQIEIESYQQKSVLELGNTPGVHTSYTPESRKTTDHNEAIRINNLVNFLTAPQNQLTNRSQVDKPFHESSIKGDIEFEKANRRESFKQLNRDGNLKDISVLNDSFRSPRFKELYPSIANNKKEFINWLNSFKKNSKSIWKK